MRSQEYFQQQERPADVAFTATELLRMQHKDGAQRVFEVVTGQDGKTLAWAVADVLCAADCEEIIRLGEVSMEDSYPGTFRTAKRTRGYHNQELADRVMGHMPPELKDAMKAADGFDVHGLHPNWRLVRYDPGMSFPAHYDQSDTAQKMRDDGSKDFYFSSHTLLINLTPQSSGTEGGATRFYPKGDYNFAVDVFLPQGWALVFVQKGLLHAGQPVHHGCKHIAQAGVLRFLPLGQTFRPNIFRFGPGLQENLDEVTRKEDIEKYQKRFEVHVTN